MRRLTNIEIAVRKWKEQPCADCGLSFPFYVMQADHVKGQKHFSIGDTSSSRRSKLLFKISLSDVLEELEKCEPVCANCHAERTHRRNVSIPKVADRVWEVKRIRRNLIKDAHETWRSNCMKDYGAP